jgi:hypothetical protein
VFGHHHVGDYLRARARELLPLVLFLMIPVLLATIRCMETV